MTQTTITSITGQEVVAAERDDLYLGNTTPLEADLILRARWIESVGAMCLNSRDHQHAETIAELRRLGLVYDAYVPGPRVGTTLPALTQAGCTMRWALCQAIRDGRPLQGISADARQIAQLHDYLQ